MTNHTVTDTLTLLRRNLRHTARYPSMTVGAIFGPVIVLLLFLALALTWCVALGAGRVRLGGGGVR